MKEWVKTKIYLVSLVFLGSCLTFYCTVFKEVDSILASSAVGLVFSTCLTEYSEFVWIGTFGGMTSEEVLGRNIGHFVGFSLLVVFFDSFLKKITGLGGKLGFIAFLSLSSMFSFYKMGETVRNFEFDFPLVKSEKYEEFTVFGLIFYPVASGLSAVAVVKIAEHAKITSLSAMGIVGILSFIGFSPFDKKIQEAEYSELFAHFAYIGSFAGASSAEKINIFGQTGINFLVAGFISGWIGISLFGVLNYGGRMGTAAFLACCLCFSIAWLKQKCSSKISVQTTETVEFRNTQPTP